MNALFDHLVELIQPPWSYILAPVVLLIVGAPRLIDLRRDLLDVRMCRRSLENERLRLEVLKLRVELGQLQQHHKIPELEKELEEITVASPPEPVPATEKPPEKAPGRFGKWVRLHPRFCRPVMLLLQILLAYMMVINAVAMIAMPIISWSDPALGHGFSVFGVIIYAGFAWLSYKGFVATRSIRKELIVR